MLPWSESSAALDETVAEVAAERGYAIEHRKLGQTQASWRLARRDGMACELAAVQGKKHNSVRCVPWLSRPGYEIALPKVQGDSDKLHELIDWTEVAIEAAFERADRLNEVIAKLTELARSTGAIQVFEMVPESHGEDVTFGCAYLNRTPEALFSVALTVTTDDQAIVCRSVVSVMNGDGSPGDLLKETLLCKTGLPFEAMKGFARGILEANEVMRGYKEDAPSAVEILEKDPKAFGENVVSIRFGAKGRAGSVA